MKRYLVIDIGSSSVRAAIVDKESLQPERIETVRRRAGELLDAGAEWETVYDLIKKLTASNRHIAGIAVSSLLGWVGTDADAEPVTPCYSYMHREDKTYRRLKEKIDPQEACILCGRRMNPEWAVFSFAALKEREPGIYRKIKYIVSLKDFINLKLTGNAAVDRISAAYTMLYDIHAGVWSERLTGTFGIEREKLPKLAEPWECLGVLRPELAREFGLSGDIPVVAGSVDGSTAVLGAGGIRAGEAVNVMGTTDVFFTVTDHCPKDAAGRLLFHPHVIPGLWLAGGPMGMFGGTVDWFVRHMGGNADLEELTQRASRVPAGCGGVFFYPNMAGERAPFWTPGFAGSILGLQPEHEAAHVFRAILEAGGYYLRQMIETGDELGIPVHSVTAIGGGARSSLWLQIKADITGKCFRTLANGEATMAGSAMLIAIWEGRTAELQPPASCGTVFYCRKDAEDQYRSIYGHWLKQHKVIRQIYM